VKPEPHSPHLRLWVREIHPLNAHYIWGGLVVFDFSSPSSSQITTLVFNQLLNHALSNKLLYQPLPILLNPSTLQSNQTKPTVNMQFKVVALFAALASVAAADYGYE
jgi:hypothetical protein